MKNSILIIFIGLILIGCTGRYGQLDLTKPVSLDMRPPDGPHEYQQGWGDGCESSLASTNDKIQKFFKTHQYYIDPYLRKKPLYMVAWKYAYMHCGYSLRTMARFKYM